MCSRKVSTICTTSLRPRGIAARVLLRLAPGLQPRRARVAAAARVGAHVGRAAEAGDPAQRRGRAVAGQVDLQRRADEQVAGVVAGGLAEGAVGAQAAVRAGEEDVRPGADVVLHADLGAEEVHRLDEAGLDGRDQRRVRVERPVPADLPLQPQGARRRSAAAARSPRCRSRCRGSGAGPVLGVDALDRHHRHQHLDLADLRRVAGEQRLDEVRRRAPTTKSTQSPGMSTRGSASTSSFTWAMTMPSRNAVASTMAGVSSVFGPV